MIGSEVDRLPALVRDQPSCTQMEAIAVYFLELSLSDVPADLGWLSGPERARAQSFRFPKRRNDWLLGRWTAKEAISSFLSLGGREVLDYQSLEIRSAPDGTPEPFLNGARASVSLALSHSSSEGFCAVAAAGLTLGCDLELIEKRNQEFIDDYLRDEEKQLVAGAEEEQRAILVTLLWSAKESALKCLHEGLRRDTRSVLVDISTKSELRWSPLTVRCLQSSKLFYGWWRRSGRLVQTITAGKPIAEPTECRR